MTITLQQLVAGIETKNGFALDPAQKNAIAYGNGPLLIPAGPGTGKTEVLIARCLKFYLLRWRGARFNYPDHVYGESCQKPRRPDCRKLCFSCRINILQLQT